MSKIDAPYYLYKITNKVNDKLYIGITNNPDRRKNQHWNFENRFNGKTINILYQAMRKYGTENFNFEVICIGSKEYILDLEIKAISAYKTTEKKFGYNIKPGGDSGRGYSVAGSKRDTPSYVSGFWFPNRRTALCKLGMSVHVYKNRQKKGILGDICILNLGAYGSGVSSFKPCYVAGFWFPSLTVASKTLCRKETTLASRIRRNTLEQGFNLREQNGENNHMFGIDPKDHPSSKSVSICGVEYNSIKEATAATGYSKYIINKRIKDKHPDFKYSER